MGNRLVNVRLDERRLEKARRLRSKGIALSQLVRDAIDREYAQVIQSAEPRDVEAIMRDIYQKAPDPPGLKRRNYDVHDRREARAAVLRKLQAPRK